MAKEWVSKIQLVEPVCLVAEDAYQFPRGPEAVRIGKHVRPDNKPGKDLFAEIPVIPPDAGLLTNPVPIFLFRRPAGHIPYLVDDLLGSPKEGIGLKAVSSAMALTPL